MSISSPSRPPTRPSTRPAAPALDPAQFEQGLNPSQREAVVHGEGPMLVLAGAGSGKTRVITHRIARMLARGVPADAILAVTFTNKAAGEMLDRIVKLVGPRAAQGLTVATFHAFGLKFLQREARYLGFGGNFTILDQGDCLGVLRELSRHLDLSGARADGGRRLDLGAVLTRISLAKNAFQTPETIPDGGDLDGDAALYQQVAKLLFGKYETALKGFHAVDFDDLICAPVSILERFPEVRERWQRRFRHVLVDEYQDTNGAQVALLRAVAGSHRNLTVVGDDDQAIYGWRGADVTNILAFEEHFTGAKVVKLEENYRSRQPILDAANAVIGAMPAKKYKKNLFTSRSGGESIQRVNCAMPDVEASFVAGEIDRLIRAGRSPGEIAVMYRSNKQSDLLEEAMRDRNIAYVTVGGASFFEKKEVKDLLGYMRLACNPLDEIALRRIINYPARGIGEQALARLEGFAAMHDAPLFRAVQRANDIEGLTSAAKEGCAALAEMLVEAKAKIIAGTSPVAIARAFADSIGLKEDLHAASPTHAAAERRWSNVEGIFRSFERFERRVENAAFSLEGGKTPSLEEFLHRLTLRFSDEEEEAGGVVTLTTLHGAKGLEYEVVFLVGLEEGIIPHKRTTDPKVSDVVEFKTDASGAVVASDGDGIDEERRLFYVGVTRARERLYLCRSRMRQERGKIAARTPSRFLQDVPDALCEAREVTEVEKQSTQVLAVKAAKAIAGFGSRPKF